MPSGWGQSNRRIGIYTAMRQGSFRLKQKLLLPVGDKLLCEWSFARASEAAAAARVPFVTGIWPNDTELVALAKRHGVEVISRTDVSARGETSETVWDPPLVSKLCERFDWIVQINACRPFLPVATIVSFVDQVRLTTSDIPLLAVFEHRGWVWNSHKERVVGIDEQYLNTKTSEAFYLPAHCLYAYPTKMLGTALMCANYSLVEIPYTLEHTIDVDTAEDLKMARAAYMVLYGSDQETAVGKL